MGGANIGAGGYISPTFGKWGSRKPAKNEKNSKFPTNLYQIFLLASLANNIFAT
jgi:hypothetical protein